MLLSSFKMLVAFIYILFFIEYSNGNLPADCGVSCVRQKTSTGIDFAYVPHEDFVVWTPPNQNLIWIYYCKTTLIEQCYNDKDRTQFLYLDLQWKTIYRGLGHYFERVGDNKIHKYDVVVMEPSENRDFVYPIDVTAFNFPAFWYYFDNNPILQVVISAGILNTYDSNKRDINNVFFVDEEDKCKSHRPTVLKRENFLNLNLYVNRKYARYSYFFIKKDNFICAYVFEHEQLFQKGPYMGDWDVLQIKPINFHMINNYPTQNYAPNFFCIDVLYGTFVSLYWDGHSHPEAHYFSIDENNLSNITLVDKMVLTDFHDGALKDIFNNEFNQQYSPTFQSYGRQVFVRIKLLHEPEKVRIAQDGDRVIWHGLWKNDKEYEVHNRDFKWKLPKFNLNLPEFSLVFIDDINVLFYAKKSWIQKYIPVLPYKTAATLPPKETTDLPPAPPVNPDPPATLPPTDESTTLPPKETTNLPPVNPGPPATMPPENEPTTLSPKETTNLPTNVPPAISTTILQPTVLTSTVPATTTTSPLHSINSSISNTKGNGNSSNTKNTTSQILPKPEAQIKNNKTLSEEDASSKDNNGCSLFDKNLGWFLISIVIIVLAEIIILVNLIVFKFRGAKKLKEAMAKKKVQKSGKKNKMKPSKKKKQQKSTKEKSTKEKSVTKTEDAGKTTASEAPKTTTVEQTNYFAVNETSKKQ